MADVRALYISSGTVTRLDPTADNMLALGLDSSTGALTLGGTNATAIEFGAAIDADASEQLVIGQTNATSVRVDDLTVTATTIDGASSGADLVFGSTNADTLSFDVGAAQSTKTISIGTANAVSVAIDDLTVSGTGIDTTGAATLSLGTSEATAITIGDVGVTTTVAGDLQVDGSETVTGSATFNGNTDIGDSSSDTLSITASVDTSINFSSAQSITTTTGDLKLIPEGSAIAQGGLGIALTGTVSATNGNATVTGSGTSFTTELNVGDAIEIRESASSVTVYTVSAIATDTSLTLDSTYSNTGGSGFTAYADDNLFEVYSGDAAARVTVGKTGGTTLTYGEADGAILTLANDEDSINAQVFVTPDEPPTMSGANGDVALTTTSGKLYFYGGAQWNETGTSTPTSLQGAYDQQISGGANPVQLLTNDWEVQIDDDAANWVISNEAGNADYIATNYTNNSIDLGSSGGKEVHFLGNVGTNITFDGTAGRTLTNAEDMTVSATGAASVLTLKSDDGAVELNGGTGTANEYVHISTGNASMIGGATTSGSIQMTTNAGTIQMDASNGAEDKTIWLTNISAGMQHNTGNISIFTTGGGGSIYLDATQSANTGNVELDGVDILLDATDQISLDAAGASNFTVDSASLTLSTTTSGNVVIDSVDVVDIDGDGVTIDATNTNGFSIDGTAASNVSVTSGILTLSTITSGDVQITAAANSDANLTASGTGAVDIDAGSGGVTIDAASGNIALTTATSGNVSMAPAGDFFVNVDSIYVDTSVGQVGINMNSGLDANAALHITALDTTDDRQIASFTNAEGTAQTCELFVSSNDPDTGAGSGTVAPAGSLCLATNGNAYINTDGTATGWEAVAFGDVSETLQEAYDNSGAPALIEMATNKDLVFRTNDTGASESDWYVTNDAGTAAFLGTDTASSQVYLGDLAGNLYVNFNGQVNSNITFDGTSRSIINDSNNLTLQTTTSGNIVVNSVDAVDIDGDGVTIDAIDTNGFSIDGTAASNVSATSGNLTLSTITSGTLFVDSAGLLDMDGDAGFNLDATGAACNVTATSQNLTVSTATSGTLFVDSAGLLDMDGAAGFNLDGSGATCTITATSQDLEISTATSGEIDITSAGIVDINSNGASTWTNDTGNLTISTTTSGTLGLQSVAALDLDGTVVTMDGSTSVAIDSAGTTLLDSSTGTTVSADAGGVTIDATAGNITLTAPAASDVVLTATDNAASDISFQAHGSAVIEFNGTTTGDAGDKDLASTFTATNIIGALNELKADASEIVLYRVVGTGGVTAGNAVYIDADDTVANRVRKSDSDATDSAIIVGFARSTEAAAGNVYVDTAGEVTVSSDLSGDAQGEYVYLSGTAGEVTTTAPTSGIVLRVGVITDVGTGAGDGKILIQIGTPVAL